VTYEIPVLPTVTARQTARADEAFMDCELWVIVDSHRYANQEAFTSPRARRVLAILDPHDLPAQFLVVGDDQKFHTVYVQDCQFHKIEDDREVFIALG
jgi:hypothetical protein